MNDTHTPEILTAKAGVPLSADYGLARHTRGSWRLQVSIVTDPALSGERITIPLGTRDKGEARSRRDVCMIALAKAGILARPVILREKAGIKTSPSASSKIC